MTYIENFLNKVFLFGKNRKFFMTDYTECLLRFKIDKLRKQL